MYINALLIHPVQVRINIYCLNFPAQYFTSNTNGSFSCCSRSYKPYNSNRYMLHSCFIPEIFPPSLHKQSPPSQSHSSSSPGKRLGQQPVQPWNWTVIPANDLMMILCVKRNYHKKKGRPKTYTQPHKVPRHLRLWRLDNVNMRSGWQGSSRLPCYVFCISMLT